MSATVPLRLDGDLDARLEKLAEVTRRSKASLAAEAIREFVENNEWQVQRVRPARWDRKAFALELAEARSAMPMRECVMQQLRGEARY